MPLELASPCRKSATLLKLLELAPRREKVVDLRILLNCLHTEGIEAPDSEIGDILSSCLKRPDLQDERRGVDGKEKNPKLVWTVDVEFLCQAFSI